MDPLYERQAPLSLSLPQGKALVVGCGGVGFWAGLFLAMSGQENLQLFDPDIIEQSNLNRLPLSSDWIGKPKVEALRGLIIALRPKAVVESMSMLLEPETVPVLSPSLVIDCTDRFKVQKALSEVCHREGIPYVRAGYDGTHITISTEVKGVWEVTNEEEDEYRITPSWVVPAVLAGALAVFTAIKDTGFGLSSEIGGLGERRQTSGIPASRP